MDLSWFALFMLSIPMGDDLPRGFDTIDGSRVSEADGLAALQSGQALLMGGLLVGNSPS